MKRDLGVRRGDVMESGDEANKGVCEDMAGVNLLNIVTYLIHARPKVARAWELAGAGCSGVAIKMLGDCEDRGTGTRASIYGSDAWSRDLKVHAIQDRTSLFRRRLNLNLIHRSPPSTGL